MSVPGSVSLVFGFALLMLGGAGHCETAQVPAATVAPLAAYGRLPNMSELALSPNGSRVALLAHTDKGGAVQIRDAMSRVLLAQVSIGNKKVRELIWEDEGHLIVTTSVTADVFGVTGPRREYWMGSEVDIEHHGVRALLNRHEVGGREPESLNTLFGDPIIARKDDGSPRLILPGTSFVENQGVLTLFEDNMYRTSILVQGGADTEQFALSRSGNIIGRIDYDQSSGKWRVLAGPDRGHLKIVQTGSNLLGSPRFAGLAPDGTHLYLWDDSAEDRHLHILDIASGALTDAPTDVEHAGILIDPATHTVIGFATLSEADSNYNFLDPSDQKFWNGIRKAFPGVAVDFVSMSADRSKIMVQLFGGDWGFSYAIVDRKTRNASFFGDVYAGIGPTELAEQKLIHYKAADGFDIPAYLTLPRGRAPKALPLILLPHGGPFARDEPGFDWWSQALASRGYAVLQPQFRGSDGFGTAHLTAGYGEYSRKMQTDLSDGAAELARQGLVDPARVAITGASYGGYASLAAVTLQSGIYRCAAAISGPANMKEHQAYIREQHNGDSKTVATRYWREFLKVKSDTDPALDDMSPALHADKASVPIMLIHGRDDTVVPISQSRHMEAALKKAGKPVEFLELKGEDHWLSRSDTRLQMLAASVRFLEGCNPP